MAQLYYIDNGDRMNEEVLHARIGEYLPSYLVKHDSKLSVWESRITQSFAQSSCVRFKKSAAKVKQDIVKYSIVAWPILFSRFFEAVKIAGPELPKNNIIIAVNCNGMFLIDDQEQILLELNFVSITYVGYEHVPRKQFNNLTLRTIRQQEFVFQSPDAENLNHLIVGLLDGLKKRSSFCIATQDYDNSGAARSFISFKQGDLIELKNGLTGESMMGSTWAYGKFLFINLGIQFANKTSNLSTGLSSTKR